VLERNLGWASHLEAALREQYSFRSVLDIGCGIGTWIHYLSRRSYKVLGFEPGKEAAAFGNRQLKVDIQARYFSSAGMVESAPFDLITCIMVMEHLRNPRELIAEIAEYCIHTGAWAFVSVPFYYGYAHFKPGARTSIFDSSAAHVTYFSESGMKKAFSDFGLQSVTPRKIVPASNTWSGLLFRKR